VSHSPTALFLNPALTNATDILHDFYLISAFTASCVPSIPALLLSVENKAKIITRFSVSLIFPFDFFVLSGLPYISLLLFFSFLLPAVPEHPNQVPKSKHHLRCY
jgi:prepilin signal peptidase PulO-like enzyme (type II secretory pathway)